MGRVVSPMQSRRERNVGAGVLEAVVNLTVSVAFRVSSQILSLGIIDIVALSLGGISLVDGHLGSRRASWLGDDGP